MRKIIDFKNMSPKQKLIFIIIITGILIASTWILRIFRNNWEIKKDALVEDYGKVKSYTYFSLQGNTTYDRQLYWDLNDIITNFIDSTLYEGVKNEYTLESYYDALTTEYKFYLGESGYNKLSESFVEKFRILSSQEENYKTTNIISEIYELPNNMYLCDLNGTNEQKAYIGIVLNKSEKTFQIFYIE